MDEMTIPKILEQIASEMCDKYCKYPQEKGHEDGWLLEKGSPCENCPLNKLT